MADEDGSALAAPDHAARIERILRAAIADGAVGPDQRLAAERALAAEHDAPRSAVRSALARLEEDGLIERRIGAGAYVRRPSLQAVGVAAIMDDVAPLQLIDVRAALEPEVARLAARNAASRDIDSMGAILDAVEAGASARDFAAGDERFHLALAEATRNPLMVWLYQEINAVRGRARWMNVRDQKLSPARVADYNRLHRGVWDAVASRDGATAAARMADHMAEVRRDFLTDSAE